MKKILIGFVSIVILFTGCLTFDSEKTFAEALDRAVKEQQRLMDEYVSQRRYGKTLPRLEGSALNKYLSSEFTEAQKNLIRQKVQEAFIDKRDNKVFPEWVGFKNSEIRRKVDSFVRAASLSASTNGFAVARENFESAREVAWQESVNAVLDGVAVAEVNSRVWATSIELLNTFVNLTEWPVIERELQLIATNAVGNGDFDTGIKTLRDYRHIRTYTVLLDLKVEALMKELGRLGVPAAATKSVADAMHKFMCEAANLALFCQNIWI